MVRKSRVGFPPPSASCGPDFTVPGPYGSSAGPAQSRITGLISPAEGAEVRRARVQGAHMWHTRSASGQRRESVVGGGGGLRGQSRRQNWVNSGGGGRGHSVHKRKLFLHNYLCRVCRVVLICGAQDDVKQTSQ